MKASMQSSLTQSIRQKAMEVGFDLCGFARAGRLHHEGQKLMEWCSAGMNGSMDYLSRNPEARADPSILLPGTASVIVTGLSYSATPVQGKDGLPFFSRYAYGHDYHEVVKGKLKSIVSFIKEAEPSASARAFVDTAPVLEKAWARKAGLGWQGRHSIIINKDIGSFFFIGIILTDLALDSDDAYVEDQCHDCRKCITCCPTGAINEDRTIDARRCIAYLTIEDENAVPHDIRGKLGGRIFGCDLCQEVCPWNRNKPSGKTAEFRISDELAGMTVEDWKNLDPLRFNRLFRKSPVRRGGYSRLRKNIDSALTSHCSEESAE